MATKINSPAIRDPVVWNQAMNHLLSHRQDSASVTDYIISFNHLSWPLRDDQPPPPPVLELIFLAGLRSEIRLKVLSLSQFGSGLSSAMAAAKFVEAQVGSHRQDPIQTKLGKCRSMNDSEFRSKVSEGLCLRCDEVENSDHRCEKKELSVLIASDEKVKEQLARMKLKGWIDGEEAVVLVSSGASHNFVASRVVEKLDLQKSQTEEYCIVIDGASEVLKGSTVCRSLGLRLTGLDIMADFVPLDLIGGGGVDVILGMEWLERLGEVEMNWKTLTMKFDYDERSVTLQGDRSLSGSVATLNSIQLHYLSEFRFEVGDENLQPPRLL